MQHCIVCGSELPEDARFCGNCGHVLSDIDTIENEPTRTLAEPLDTANTTHIYDIGSENELPQDDLATIDTQLLTQHKSNGHTQLEAASMPEISVEADEPLAQSTQAHPLPEIEEPSAQAAQSTQAHPLPEEEEPKFQSEEASSAEPAEASAIDTPPPIILPPTPLPQAPAAKTRRGARWLPIALVVLLLIAASAAALVYLLHVQLPGANATSAIVTAPTTSGGTNITPVDTFCPLGSASCTSITPGLTPILSGTPATINMTFSGAVQGDMTVTSIARCGPSSSGSEYDVYFSGTVGGTSYTFVSRIISYTGPATYNVGHIFVVFSQQPLSPSTVWGNPGNLAAQATVNSDTKSGTMEIDLSGSINSVHVSGSWSCA